MGALGKNRRNDVPMHVRQPAFGAVVVEAELFVVDTEEVEDGGVEVVDGGDVFDGFVAEFVGGAVAEGGFHARAHEKRGKPAGVVVTAAGAFLKSGHAAEFGGPNDEGVFE